MQNEKTHENPPPISGGYGRRLKKEESAKGFTLVELIVVIVILAILAAILIPGLLKWIDQAKDKKYELEAREIALAAEAALTKMYAQGAGVLVIGDKLVVSGEQDLAKVPAFQDELAKFTDAAVTGIEIYGEPDAGSSWGGSVSGFEMDFKASDGAEITAELLPDTNRWVINGSSDGTGGESGDDPPETYELKAQEIAQAAEAALRKVHADGREVYEWHDGLLEYWSDIGGYGNFMGPCGSEFEQEITKLTDADVRFVLFRGEGWTGTSPQFKAWEGGSVTSFNIYFVASNGVNIYAELSPTTGGWKITEDPDGWGYWEIL